MANISSARGTLTLVGYWSGRAVELFHPVLKSWEFHGAYGMSAYRMPTPNRPSVEFSGTGRWSFSSMLALEFDSWTRDWIKNPATGTRHPLTQEQYDALLQVMAQNDLSIRVEFNDKGEEGYDMDEVGVFTSDGESLNYEVLSCHEAEHDWTEMSREYFDGAVLYFQRLAPDADPNQIKKWVKVNIGPSSLFYGGTACLGDLYAEGAEGTFDEERFQDFRAAFSPRGEAWDAFVEECSSEFYWNIDPENLSNALQDSEDPDWTEADEAWYQAWKSNKGDTGNGGGYQDREYALGPACIPLDSGEPVTVRGSRFVLAGRFSLCGGDKAKITHMIEFMKGRCTDRVTKATNYVVLGREGGLNWSDWENYVKAREQMEQGSGLRLIGEDELTAVLGDNQSR